MIKIEKLDHYGRGIAKLNNKTIFVKNALPEEIVEIKIDSEKKNYIDASVLKYINKSNKRIKPTCPYYDTCGGCNIMHLSYEDQLKFKQDKIENILNKYLNKKSKINNIIYSDTKEYYRNKVTFQVKENVGFYKSKTYDVIAIDCCRIANNLINNSIKYLKMLNLKDISKIICKTASNELMVVIETKNNNLDISPIKDIAQSIYLKVNNKYIHVFGSKYIYQNLENFKFKISPDSFFQVNINTCLKLYNKIKEYVGTNKNIIDLYCGTGSIGIFISENNNVIGIEINESAIKDAIENKKLNNLKSINFLCGDSGKKLKGLNFNPDIIIVDPPRSGLNKETIDNILKFNPQEIVYVSCDPMTLVRDLNILGEQYIIKEITPFDMFPNTYHIENIVHLIKKM